jgi:hypothetical protein
MGCSLPSLFGPVAADNRGACVAETQGPDSGAEIQSRQLKLDCAYLDYKLMDLPNDLAAKTLLLEKTWDLERQFGEEYFVIWAGKRQTSQVIAPCANAAALNIRDSYRNDSQLFIHRPISRICFKPALAGIFR